MRRQIKSLINLLLLCILIPVSILGWIVPGPWGLPFLVLILIILSVEFPWIDRYIDSKINKESKFGAAFIRIKNKAERFFR